MSVEHLLFLLFRYACAYILYIRDVWSAILCVCSAEHIMNDYTHRRRRTVWCAAVGSAVFIVVVGECHSNGISAVSIGTFTATFSSLTWTLSCLPYHL